VEGRRKRNYEHSTRRQCHEDEDANFVWYQVYKVRGTQFGHERRYDICEKDYALGHCGAYEIKGGGKDDDIEEVVQEALKFSTLLYTEFHPKNHELTEQPKGNVHSIVGTRKGSFEA
jgi:hypothetical protein